MASKPRARFDLDIHDDREFEDATHAFEHLVDSPLSCAETFDDLSEIASDADWFPDAHRLHSRLLPTLRPCPPRDTLTKPNQTEGSDAWAPPRAGAARSISQLQAWRWFRSGMRITTATSLVLGLTACGGPEPAATQLTTWDALSANELTAWFADYHGNHGTNYLQAPHTGTYYADGDPNFDSPHVYVRGGRYGPKARHRFDVWIPTQVTGLSPIAIYFHGGGFVTGSRDDHGVNVDHFLERGIAFAAVDYRYAYADGAVALAQGVPNDDGTDSASNGARLDYVLRDCARAVQFFKYRGASWNLDKGKVGVVGHSAGGGCAAWVGAVPDLMIPSHNDPVLRESTRVHAVQHLASQVSYNFQSWGAQLGLNQNWVNRAGAGFSGMTQMTVDEQRNTSLGRDLMSVLDFYQSISSNDPPMFFGNQGAAASNRQIYAGADVLHDPRNAYALYERCLAQGLECELDVADVARDTYSGPAYSWLTGVLSR